MHGKTVRHQGSLQNYFLSVWAEKENVYVFDNQNLTDPLAGLKNEMLCFEILAVVSPTKLLTY